MYCYTYMKALVNDQIHTPAWQKLCDYMWADDATRPVKSGVWEYAVQCARDYNMKIINQDSMPDSGVIFVGMCHLLEYVFNSMPRSGNYIIVHRTNDRPFTELMYKCKPPSVKHIYTVDSRVKANDVSAIPFGNASINGEDILVKKIAKEKKRKTDKKLFVCYNTNPDTPHRNASIPILKQKDFAFVYELEYPHKQMAGDEFYRNVHAHKYTMALAGCGADASRQWAAMQLGSIPIVTDCIEMRHFEDLPMIYCPEDMNDITEEWLDKQDVSGKSTERMRMSYWAKHLTDKRIEYGI
jgi:hypothetical protein